MKLSNQRKGAAVVLGLGVLALGIDRFVLRAGESGPAAAHAAPTTSEHDSLATQLVDATPAAAVIRQGPTLSDLLEKHRGTSHDIGDAFSVPPEWTVVANADKPIDQPVKPHKEISDPLASKMKLSAVSQGRTENGGSAIVNGRTLVQGERNELDIGGEKYEVVLLSTPTHDTAVIQFADSGREVTIKRTAMQSSENSTRTSR